MGGLSGPQNLPHSSSRNIPTENAVVDLSLKEINYSVHNYHGNRQVVVSRSAPLSLKTTSDMQPNPRTAR